MYLQTIQSIIGAIALMIAYVFATMLVGRAEAQAAVYAGDDTPAQAGFLSWDPLLFADFPGFLCVLFLGIGWGRQLPFNPHHVTGKHKKLSVFLVYMTQPLVSILLAFFAMIICIVLIGPGSLRFTSWGLTENLQGVPFLELSENYPHASSRLLICCTVLLATIGFSMFNAVWTMINNGFHYLLFIGHEEGHDYMKHAEALTFFGPLVALILYSGILRYVMLKYLGVAALAVTKLLGVV